MKNTTLQIPMKKQIRDKATLVAEKQGFSSLQEAVRVFVSQLATHKVHISFNSDILKLSDKNENRYSKMINNVKIKKIKTKSFSDTNKLMDYLKQ